MLGGFDPVFGVMSGFGWCKDAPDIAICWSFRANLEGRGIICQKI